MTDLLYIVLWAPSLLVIYAFAVRISRDVELTGRLKGRSTPQLVAGGMATVHLAFVAVVLWALGIPLEELAGGTDLVVFGVVGLAGAFLVSLATLGVVRVLPQRRRRGPNQRVNRTVAGATKAVSSTFVFVLVGVLGLAWLTAIANGIGSFDVGDWLLVLFLLPLSMGTVVAYLVRTRQKAKSNAARLRARPASLVDERQRVLYLRPFNEEHRLFAESKTFETFLGEEIARQIGPLVALGNPTDRVVPEGAERIYCDDDNWQATVETLAGPAPCIVGVTSASPNTAWELNRVRELGFEKRLYLVSPPAADAPSTAGAATHQRAGPVRKALGSVGRSMASWLTQDWDALSREVSFGELPSSLSPASQTTWEEFVETLVACGYTIDVPDPGPGAVLGFATSGNALLLTRSAIAAADFVRPIAARCGVT
jgi:hypothetical protein